MNCTRYNDLTMGQIFYDTRNVSKFDNQAANIYRDIEKEMSKSEKYVGIIFQYRNFYSKWNLWNASHTAL
jgi:hypothetical protein